MEEFKLREKKKQNIITLGLIKSKLLAGRKTLLREFNP